MTTAAAPPAGTNETAGARRIAAAFARAEQEGRAALILYAVAGYPDAETSFEIALAQAPYTALRSWLEAVPPGHNVNVA